MTVYVDTMQADFGRMVMCHMIADTEDELHEMAAAIGVARKWYQGDHYDICKSKKAKALKLGAVEITQMQLSAMAMLRRYGHEAGGPHDAVERFRSVAKVQRRKRRIEKLIG